TRRRRTDRESVRSRAAHLANGRDSTADRPRFFASRDPSNRPPPCYVPPPKSKDERPAMTQPTVPNAPKPPQAGGAGIQPQGGAAILAPITAFPNGVPGNALVLIPLGPNGAAVENKIVTGPMALTMEEVWKLLG